MSYIAALETDIGREKKRNQDGLSLKIAYSRWGMVCMAVICDGVGGLSQGEVASGNVIRAFDEWFKNDFLKADQEWTENKIKSAWESIIFTMNAKIKDYGCRKRIELGTTLTVVLFIRNRYYVAHVGDCRLYELVQQCRQLTHDQTLVANENVLLQCIGITNDLRPDFICGSITANASYLLCSDGFRHVVTEREIYLYCNPEENMTQYVMQQNLRSLIELNKQRGERDNISAILIRAGNVT